MEHELPSPLVDLSCELAPGASATQLLEQGKVLWLPQSPFGVRDDELELLTPRTSDGKAKNVRYDPLTGELGGTALQGPARDALAAMLARYELQARELVASWLPSYLEPMRTRLASFRPVAVEGRASSARKDDTRLHVDAFASRPNHGWRLLRVFTNINPQGRARVWKVGEEFEAFARRFLARVPRYSPTFALWLERLHITKSRRSEYDHYMLHLHDLAKLDEVYQREAPQLRVEFPAGSTWICFSDQVLHAVLAGQFMMEQTYFLPVQAMEEPQRSPLGVLERLLGRRLVGTESASP